MCSEEPHRIHGAPASLLEGFKSLMPEAEDTGNAAQAGMAEGGKHTRLIEPVSRRPRANKRQAPSDSASRLLNAHVRDVKRARRAPAAVGGHLVAGRESEAGPAPAAAAGKGCLAAMPGIPTPGQHRAAAAAAGERAGQLAAEFAQEQQRAAEAEYARQVEAARQAALQSPLAQQQQQQQQQKAEAVPLKAPGAGLKRAAARSGRSTVPQQQRAPPSQIPTRRLERQVLCGRLWHADCQAATSDLPEELPLSFEGIEQYQGTFEPLLFEEARESIRAQWVGACEHGRLQTVDIASVEEQGGGWFMLKLVGCHSARDGSVVVLTQRRPPGRGAAEWLQPGGRGQKPLHAKDTPAAGAAKVPVVTGIVRAAGSGSNGALQVAIAPRCEAHARDEEGCCGKVISKLRDQSRRWTLVNVGALTTQEREFKALQLAPYLHVLEHLLHPERLQQWQMSPETAQRMWPPELAHPAFHRFLSSQYDDTQLHAIQVAAAHLGESTSLPDHPVLPFLLIQGPPGTGKTHTVKGVLNVWSLVAYQRYFKSLVRALMSDRSRSNRESLQNSLNRTLPDLVQRPRILVCAPSNAATDELLERVMRSGFAQVQGSTYRPNLVRIGAEEANISSMARDVWSEQTIQRLLNLSPPNIEARLRHHQSIVYQQSTLAIEYQRAAIAHTAEVEQLQAQLQLQAGNESMQGALQGQLQSKQRELDSDAAALVHAHEERDRSLVQMRMLEEAQGVARGLGGPNGAREARDNLELSLVAEADMVFTTLSSTGRRIFSRLEGAFETVLVDEAAQASEVAVLQPLLFGCKRAVLVGDPQQLPATILSRDAQLASMERSLFERLQLAGCPVTLLQVQYRMHPSIRQFPSRYFYEDRLIDGPNIKNAPKPLFYENELLTPYAFYDISAGQQERMGKSLRNQAEADMAACLFWELRSFLHGRLRAGQRLPGPVLVGVVTPYKEQCACLQQTFRALCGAEAADEVLISTVDSFQGKQLDVIIMSCVRAGGRSAGIGFLSDVRRLNVAITRAKHALWILGSRATLQGSQVWADLLDDADRRGLVIDDVSAPEFFEDVESETRDRLTAMLQEREEQRAPSQPAAEPPQTVQQSGSEVFG